MSIDALRAYTEEVAIRSAARTKNYLGPAFAVLFLYPVFILPGLVANILYVKDATRMEKLAKEPLTGTGCLWALFIMGPVLAYVYYVMFKFTTIANDLIHSLLSLF